MSIIFLEAIEALVISPWLSIQLLILAFLIWFLAWRLRKLQYFLVHPLIFGLVFCGLGHLLLGPIFAWVVIILLLGLGYSLRTLAFDLVSGLLLRIEARLIDDAWVEGDGFDGRVKARLWRGVILCDAFGRETIVPNHLFLHSCVTISNPGEYYTTITCWIPKEKTAFDAEQEILQWLRDSPWVSQCFSIYPDAQNLNQIVVELSLLRAEDKHKVLSAVRALIEKGNHDLRRT